MKTNVLIFFGLAKVLLFQVKMKYLACLIRDIKDIYFWVPRGLIWSTLHVPSQENFKGAKSFIGTPEMQIIFVFKDKLFCSMKNA